jgi:organic radical activating enzyme
MLDGFERVPAGVVQGLGAQQPLGAAGFFREGDGGAAGWLEADSAREAFAELARWRQESGYFLGRVWLAAPAGASAPEGLPALSGEVGNRARIEFLASRSEGRDLPGSPGEVGAGATVFEAGGRQFLLTRGMVGGGGDLIRGLEGITGRLRAISAIGSLERVGLTYGFRVEDIVSVRVVVRDEADRAAAERWLRRRLPQECAVHIVTGQLLWGGLVSVEAVFARRGEVATSQRKQYARAEGRIRVEAFELHVVEHCNLRCAHCCNMSPYVADRMLSVAEVEAQCRTMARHLDVDVFKIMGGEPLLHPEITAILAVLRATGISETIRLFTNGLLLHRMADDFWRALDHLTISSYSSAPVKPEHLRLVEDKAREFDVVLNVKPVDRFSEVMAQARRADDAATQAVYEACWLRHRCLVVRGGVFYKCTRAAYQRDFRQRLTIAGSEIDALPEPGDDGIALDAMDFEDRLLAYLNADKALSACRYCHGSSGPLVDHVQLSRRDVREGRFLPAPKVSSRGA